MLAIKLAKTGKTNKRMFRLIISEKSRDPYGRVLEILGSYNPHSKELQAKGERVKYWLSQGAQMTKTVNNLLLENKIIEGEKVVASKPGKKNKKKLEQIKTKEGKKATADNQKSSPSEKKADQVSDNSEEKVETEKATTPEITEDKDNNKEKVAEVVTPQKDDSAETSTEKA